MTGNLTNTRKPVGPLHIMPVISKEQIARVHRLFSQYADSLSFDLEFQGFRRELASLPGDYGPPGGCILLARCGNNFVGCVALRPLADDVCEMKRLYVLPEYRGKGIGRALANALIEKARQIGYKKMRLDTVASMKKANALYAWLGFYQIDAYRHNPLDEACYLELEL